MALRNEIPMYWIAHTALAVHHGLLTAGNVVDSGQSTMEVYANKLDYLLRLEVLGADLPYEVEFDENGEEDTPAPFKDITVFEFSTLTEAQDALGIVTGIALTHWGIAGFDTTGGVVGGLTASQSVTVSSWGEIREKSGKYFFASPVGATVSENNEYRSQLSTFSFAEINYNKTSKQEEV